MTGQSRTHESTVTVTYAFCTLIMTLMHAFQLPHYDRTVTAGVAHTEGVQPHSERTVQLHAMRPPLYRSTLAVSSATVPSSLGSIVPSSTAARTSRNWW